jgi:hypothetical protein
MAASERSILELGDALIGDWTSESEHRLFPGTVIDGRATFEWLERGTFLVWRDAATHPDFPGSALAVIGGTDELRMHYFDSRGVVRLFEMSIADGAWSFVRTGDDDFDQRLTWTLEDDGSVRGLAEIREDGENWADDLWTTYRRA